MSKQGFMIYAHNNEQHDYLKQAVWSADRIERMLKKPVTIITDEQSLNHRKFGHNVIITKPNSLGKRNMASPGVTAIANWHNANRHTAYDMTPYEETIVLDSDYIVDSTKLNILFNSAQQTDFLCHRSVFDLTGCNTFAGDETFGQFRMPHFWATVLFFRRSEFAESIFTDIEMVRNQWKFFGQLYKFDTSLYRNDYAVSIALLIAYGHRVDDIKHIPWKLTTAGLQVSVKESKYKSYKIQYDKLTRNRVMPMSNYVSGLDIHCLNKFALEKMINDQDVYRSF